MKTEDYPTYMSFFNRLREEIKSPKRTPWMDEVGYRPQDKDCGLRRWAELCGKSIEDGLDEFRDIHYPTHEKQKKEEAQMSLQF